MTLAYPVFPSPSRFPSCLRSHSLTRGHPHALLSSGSAVLLSYTQMCFLLCTPDWKWSLLWFRFIVLQVAAQLFQRVSLTDFILSWYLSSPHSSSLEAASWRESFPDFPHPEEASSGLSELPLSCGTPPKCLPLCWPRSSMGGSQASALVST